MLQGAGGMIVWPAEFLAGVRRLCDRYGTLLIADEVLTGFGRTGRMFACEHAGGRAGHHLPVEGADRRLPAARRDGRDRARSTRRSSATTAAKTFFHGHSFTANPLACAVALASLDLFARQDVLGASAGSSGSCARGSGAPRDRRASATCASSAASASSSSCRTRQTRSAGGYLDGIGPRLAAAFLERGLLLRPLGNVLYFMPPYVITDDEVDWAIDADRGRSARDPRRMTAAT